MPKRSILASKFVPVFVVLALFLSPRFAAAEDNVDMLALNRDVVRTFADALYDPDATVKEAAAWALTTMGPLAVEAVPALARALDDSGSAVRLQCCMALGAIGHGAAEAVVQLAQALSDSSIDVRVEAAKALASIGEHGGCPSPLAGGSRRQRHAYVRRLRRQ